jgi:hypothetical protein
MDLGFVLVNVQLQGNFIHTYSSFCGHRTILCVRTGGRTGRFTPSQQKISPLPFTPHPALQDYMDNGLYGDCSAPPPICSPDRKPAHHPTYVPAGLDRVDMHKAATRPKRNQAAARLKEGLKLGDQWADGFPYSLCERKLFCNLIHAVRRRRK